MRSEHDLAARPFERLSRMRGCDVAPDQPDPRGWTVVDRQGHRVGQVKDLLVDTERLTATYLDVELDTKLFDFAGDDPHVLVPVEFAQQGHKRVAVEAITPSWVRELRRARDLHRREFWDRWWQRGESGRAARQAHPASSADLHRVIDDVRPGETVRIPVVDEEIIVERRPVGRG